MVEKQAAVVVKGIVMTASEAVVITPLTSAPRAPRPALCKQLPRLCATSENKGVVPITRWMSTTVTSPSVVSHSSLADERVTEAQIWRGFKSEGEARTATSSRRKSVRGAAVINHFHKKVVMAAPAAAMTSSLR